MNLSGHADAWSPAVPGRIASKAPGVFAALHPESTLAPECGLREGLLVLETALTGPIRATSGLIPCVWPGHIDDWMNETVPLLNSNVNEKLTVENSQLQPCCFEALVRITLIRTCCFPDRRPERSQEELSATGS